MRMYLENTIIIIHPNVQTVLFTHITSALDRQEISQALMICPVYHVHLFLLRTGDLSQGKSQHIFQRVIE